MDYTNSRSREFCDVHGEEFEEDGKSGGATGRGKRPTQINSREMTKDQLGECKIRQSIARGFVRAMGIGKGREILRRDQDLHEIRVCGMRERKSGMWASATG